MDFILSLMMQLQEGRTLLERSSDLSTVLRLNAVNFELVLFILHLNLSSLTAKKDRYKKLEAG